jgi:hypothetical protein
MINALLTHGNLASESKISTKSRLLEPLENGKIFIHTIRTSIFKTLIIRNQRSFQHSRNC